MHKAKKSLGQNFLKSILALNKIIEVGEVTEKDIILEIGPGKGVLTQKLLEKAGKVVAIEKDEDLIEFLNVKFEEEIKNRKLILINEDILEFRVSDLHQNFIARGSHSVPGEGRRVENFDASAFKYKIIANIPYNITGAILKKFLSERAQPERMVLMVQNEVAKRIVANDKKESILSISVKAYGIPKLVMKVPARYFAPAPKVDSAVISIKNISKEVFLKENVSEELFFEVLKKGFAHKRKVLIKNLEAVSDRQDLIRIFNQLGIKENTRPEDLSIDKWINIAKIIKPLI